MKRSLRQVVLIGVFALSSSAFASDNVNITSGLFNGHFWNGADGHQRIGYIQGGCDFRPGTCPKGMTYIDIAESVTEFYKEPENRNIPIGWAVMLFVNAKAKGYSPAELEQLKADMRKENLELETPKSN